MTAEQPTLIPVSVMILTFNEEANLARCLDRLPWCDDLIVIDSFSTDKTLGIAREHPGRPRIFQNPFEDFGQQRNWALDHTEPRQAWILFLDADEFFTPELEAELRGFIAGPGGFAGAFIAGKNFFLGRWLKHSTFYPSYQLRLLKQGEVRYRKAGHGQQEVTEGPLCYFKTSWIHEAFSKGIEQWIGRHNRYSTEEVDLILEMRASPLRLTDLMTRDPIRRRRALKRLGARVPLRPFIRFAYTYFLRLGFLDGRQGFLFCLLRLGHELNIYLKLNERLYLEKHRKTSQNISEHRSLGSQSPQDDHETVAAKSQ